MVVTPPFPHFHHDAARWQSLFAVATAASEKSMQNAGHRDIPATVGSKAKEF
jgi:hypothetical protein